MDFLWGSWLWRFRVKPGTVVSRLEKIRLFFFPSFGCLETTNLIGSLMGQGSHMLPKLSYFSNYLCQSMNLAPRAIEEWDNEPLSLCGLCTYSVGYHYEYRRKIVWHPIFNEGMSRPLSWWLSLLCLLTETVSMVETLLSDSPWEHCFQLCLAFKHASICLD